MVDDEIRDQRSQWSPRNVCIATTKSKPHTARRQWHVIIENLWEIGMNIVPMIYKRSAFAIWGTLCFLLVRMVRFGINSLFAYIACGGRIEGNLFSLTVGRTLTFCWHHGATVNQSKQMKVFERENMVKKGKWRKCLC